MNLLHNMKDVLLYIWQLPQNLVGLVWLCILKILGPVAKEEIPELPGAFFYKTQKVNGGVCLGKYIFTCGTPYAYRQNKDTYKHEWGHSKQSKMLGWLYLFVIGIPSATGNLFDQIFHSNWLYLDSIKWYYNQPWEKWADKLGGVDRKYPD